MRRHAALRTTFPTVDGQPVQAIVARARRAHAARRSERPARSRARAGNPAASPPPKRNGAGTWPAMPAAAGDGAAPRRRAACPAGQYPPYRLRSSGRWRSFTRELVALYATLSAWPCRSRGRRCRSRVLHYHDFARWQRARAAGEARERQLAYWKRQLAGIPPAWSCPPTDHDRRIRRCAARRSRSRSRRSLAGALAELGRARGRDTVYDAAGGVQRPAGPLFGPGRPAGRLADRQPRRARSSSRPDRLFLNTLVLRTDLSGDPTFRELLAGCVR